MSFLWNKYGEFEMPNIKTWIAMGLLALTGMTGCMAGMPMYNVWEQEQVGRAELARASQNRQIATYEATAALARAEGEANAEIARARGNAEANRIIADGLGGPEGYLEYLYIQALKDSETEVIYVPTEAGLPILEAGRRNQE